MNTKPNIAREGLSVVVAPPGATSDIIFVHGLQGHPEKTWTYRDPSQAQKKFGLFGHKKHDSEPTNGTFWPFELLSRDSRLKEARILTYGYDSVVANFFGPQNQQNISRHGNDLMVALQQERRDEPNRPLIFVTHSLGGILVKVALVKSRSSRQTKLLSIFQSTKGIVFLGTPHSGSNSAAWGLLATNLAKFALQGSNQRVLRGLAPNSELLETLSEQFRQLLDEGTFSVHSFYETQTMSTMYGIEDKVVPYHSATLGDVKRETIMGINADHRGICKFGSVSDPGYKAVIGAIMDYLESSLDKETQGSNVGKSCAFQQHGAPSQEDVASFVTDAQTLIASPYGNTLSGKRSLATTTNFEGWHSNEHVVSLATTHPDTFGHYLSALGLSESELKTYGHPSPLVQEEGSPIKHGWFFDNPDFTDWDCDRLTKILQLGGQSKQENWTVFLELSKLLEDRGSTLIYFSSSFSEGERNGRLKPLEQSYRVLRSVISQLAGDDISLLLDLVGHEAMHGLTRAQPLSQSNVMLNNLARLLYHLLVAQQEDRLYVLIDGLDVLGPEMGRFIDELLSLQETLRKPKTDNRHQPVVKIFISTPPQATVRGLGQRAGKDDIIYIEKNKEMQDCLQTLYTTDFDARPATVHDPDSSTYHWLEEDESYKKWESSDSSSLLLIQGKPGSGKSTLAKIVVKAIKASKDVDESLVAYFFYSYRGGQKETSHTIMMQSILYQLLDQEPDFFPAFRERYRAQRRSNAGTVRWTLDDLIQIFGALSNVKREGKVFVILDSMDESDNEDLPVILKTMASVCSSKSLGLFKGIMTTRPLRRKVAGVDVEKLTDLSLIMENKNRSDINEVVDQEIGRILEDVMSTEDEVDSTVFDGIKEYIKEHAEGVFLWVDLVLREFKSLSEEGISKSQLDQLKTMLPPMLTDVYRQITERLAKNRPTEIQQGRKLLELAAFALERLRLEEIGDAIIIPSYLEAEHFIPNIGIMDDRVRFLTRRIRMICGDLLDIRKPFVQLIHESVRDFLLSEDQIAAPFHISAEQGKNEATSIFTRYLAWSLSPQILTSAGITKNNTAEWEESDYEAFLKLLEDRPLLNHVLSSLPKHIEQTTHKGIKDEFNQIIKDFETSEPARYLLLDSAFSLFLPIPTDDEVANASSFRFKALVLAARLGHVRAIRQLATVDTPMQPRDDETEMTPLHAAIVGGQQRAFELLFLDLLADPFAQDLLGETALHKVVTCGQLEMMKTILEDDVYADVPNLTQEMPLHLAASRGQGEMVKLLLDHKADVDSANQYDATPLHKAVQNDHVSVAEILLQNGAEVDADAPVNEAGEYGATPLHSAASEGQSEMISLLKEHGANVLEKDRYGLTAWNWAKANGHSHVLDFLHAADAENEEETPQEQPGLSDISVPFSVAM
ncbi:P-loop containing nucleoside triphosphate hydrolase [Fusarium albosuccineum]|uniref:P-loop containing nucleoside triphosphate hydrolase n=1 Tax=Fusarium albosuccineum TaxID=1237068 RepID=A0A8H4LJG0_9HYPO|nr:P-loop containing nucleoside triphosphate hydrolase [Fusarium albosuccineum]